MYNAVPAELRWSAWDDLLSARPIYLYIEEEEKVGCGGGGGFIATAVNEVDAERGCATCRRKEAQI